MFKELKIEKYNFSIYTHFSIKNILKFKIYIFSRKEIYSHLTGKTLKMKKKRKRKK